MSMVQESRFEDHGIDTKGRVSGKIKTICPKCGPDRKHRRDPSLSVDLDLGVWRCHNAGCDCKGSLGRRNPYDEKYTKVYRRPHVPDTRTLSGYARAWFEKRGLDPDLAEEYGCYTGHTETVQEEDERTGQMVDKVKNYGDRVLTIPYRSETGEVFHVKHRSLDKKAFWSSKDTELIFWGLDKLQPDTDTVIITEGEYDMLALVQCGFDNVLSVPNGASESKNAENELAYLARAEELFNRKGSDGKPFVRKVIIATDGDQAGRALADEFIRRLGPERCWRIEWPGQEIDENGEIIPACKDANDVLMRHGSRALAAVADHPIPVPVVGLFTGHGWQAELDNLYDNGADRGLGSGWPIFDEHYRLMPGYTTIITGIPGHGKSSWLDMLMVRMARTHGWKFAIFSPEQQPLIWHQQTLIQQALRKPFFDGSPQPRMSKQDMHRANRWVSDHFTYVLPEDVTLDAILDAARLCIFQTGVKGVVIDPWNEIEHLRPAGFTESEYIGWALMKVRRFARDLGVHVFVVAHPTKLKADSTGKEPIPTMYDISGTANWYNKADFGLVVYRDKSAPLSPVQVHVVKVRRRELASEGRVLFQYDGATKVVDELPAEAQFLADDDNT